MTDHSIEFLHDDTCEVCGAHRRQTSAAVAAAVAEANRGEILPAVLERRSPSPAVSASHQASTAARVAGDIAASRRWRDPEDAVAFVRRAIPDIYEAIAQAASGVRRPSVQSSAGSGG